MKASSKTIKRERGLITHVLQSSDPRLNVLLQSLHVFVKLVKSASKALTLPGPDVIVISLPLSQPWQRNSLPRIARVIDDC